MAKYYTLPCPCCGEKRLREFGLGLICDDCDGLVSFAAYNRLGGKAYKSEERERAVFGALIGRNDKKAECNA